MPWLIIIIQPGGYFGGREDIDRKVIRCVGNPTERFTEDALRILRAIRFSAQLGFEIEDATRQAITEIAPNLIHVSKERIQVELTKLLLSDRPQTMKLVYETGISPMFLKHFTKWEKCLQICRLLFLQKRPFVGLYF